MKIILLHYTSPPIIGGVETVLARQARQLVRAGHKVTILAGRGRPWDIRIGVETINLLDLRHPQVLRVKASLDAGEIPSDFDDLVEQIENDLRRAFEGVQVVIAHNVASVNKHLALTVALHNLSQEDDQPRMILWHHDLALAADGEQPDMHDGWPWDLLHTDWPGVKQVAMTDSRRQELAALLGLPLRQVTLVPAGIDLTDFLDLPPHLARLFGDLQLSLKAPILLCPVKLIRRKNLELALEILAELRKRMPHAILLITGQAGSQGKNYFEQLQKISAQLELDNSVIFLTERFPEGLSEKALGAFYRLADAVLITSREEGFGMPLLEAGLSGIPIFCTALEPLRALAGENAVYFSLDDSVKQIAGLIVGRLQADPLYRMRVRIRHDFSWDAIYHKRLAPLLEP